LIGATWCPGRNQHGSHEHPEVQLPFSLDDAKPLKEQAEGEYSIWPPQNQETESDIDAIGKITELLLSVLSSTSLLQAELQAEFSLLKTESLTL
jgi:hypothetical protein